MIQKFSYLLLFLFFTLVGNAQVDRGSFLKFLENIKKNKGFLELEFSNFINDADWMYEKTLPYIKGNDNESVVYYYSVAWVLAARTPSKNLKKKILNLFIEGADNKVFNTSIYCIRTLKLFKKEEYEREEIRKVLELLKSRNTPKFDLLLLCGYLNVKSEKKYIKKYIKKYFIGNYKPSYDQPYYKSNEWAAYLALSRMGDKASLQYILQKFRTENDLLEKCLTMSTQLDYVKRKETHNELINIFTSDLVMPPDYPATKGILCGQGFLNFLAKSVKNYPYPIKRVYYPEDIKKARAWFATRPKIIINRDIF